MHYKVEQNFLLIIGKIELWNACDWSIESCSITTYPGIGIEDGLASNVTKFYLLVDGTKRSQIRLFPTWGKDGIVATIFIHKHVLKFYFMHWKLLYRWYVYAYRVHV